MKVTPKLKNVIGKFKALKNIKQDENFEMQPDEKPSWTKAELNTLPKISYNAQPYEEYKQLDTENDQVGNAEIKNIFRKIRLVFLFSYYSYC